MEENEIINENIEETVPSLEEIRKFRKEIIIFLLTTIILLISVYFLVFPLFLQNTYKPAIYLYPEQTAQISVKLDKSIKYNNVIPKYTENGWFVQAEPNGNLKDLQPEYTFCSELPYKDFGFEYSKTACETNQYPYIYWDGVQTTKLLPVKNEGFIVKAENITAFLNEKADELKFNDKEKTEFIRYWSEKILEKNWKYYRIYFLQNEEVDNYYPLHVEPKPDSSNRIQIVIRKAEKNENPKEQKLIPVVRNGFTLVEWGGII